MCGGLLLCGFTKGIPLQPSSSDPHMAYSDAINRLMSAPIRTEQQRRVGVLMTSITKTSAPPITSFDTGPALRFPSQGQFHVLKYLRGLAAAAKRFGVEIYNQTQARDFHGGENARSRPIKV